MTTLPNKWSSPIPQLLLTRDSIQSLLKTVPPSVEWLNGYGYSFLQECEKKGYFLNDGRLWIENLSQKEDERNQLFINNRQTWEKLVKKVNACRKIEGIVLNLFKNCQQLSKYIKWGPRVIPVGSSMTFFADNSSDLDVCLVIQPDVLYLDKDKTIAILKRIKEAIEQRPEDYENIELIDSALVPVLKVTDIENEIQCDLNINNMVGIINTKFLRLCSAHDDRVSKLVLLVKIWAKNQLINEAKAATIASYPLTLMVINYLQYGCRTICGGKTLLPDNLIDPEKVNVCLYEEGTRVYDDNLSSSLSSHNQHIQLSVPDVTVTQLFAGFLHFYANFDWENFVPSVLKGKVITRAEAMKDLKNDYYRGNYLPKKFMAVQEPFILLNTTQSVYDIEKFQLIRNSFQKSARRIIYASSLEMVLKCHATKQERTVLTRMTNFDDCRKHRDQFNLPFHSTKSFPEMPFVRICEDSSPHKHESPIPSPTVTSSRASSPCSYLTHHTPSQMMNNSWCFPFFIPSPKIPTYANHPTPYLNYPLVHSPTVFSSPPTPSYDHRVILTPVLSGDKSDAQSMNLGLGSSSSMPNMSCPNSNTSTCVGNSQKGIDNASNRIQTWRRKNRNYDKVHF